MARRARWRHPRRDGPREPAAHPAREGAGRVLRNPAPADGQPCRRTGSQSGPPPRDDGVLMEVRPGYRQTEMGVIPEDWDAARLGDKTTKVGSGVTPIGGTRVYTQEGRPFLRSQNVGWGKLLLDDVAFIDDETHATF